MDVYARGAQVTRLVEIVLALLFVTMMVVMAWGLFTLVMEMEG
jgi:hypothetical protein